MQKMLCAAALLLSVRVSAQWISQPRMTYEPIARYGKIADTLYALTEGFLYKSADGARHWQLLPNAPLSPPNFASNDRNLWINPLNQRIYIQDVFTLLESRDFGQSWGEIPLPGVQAPVFTMGFSGDTIYLADLTQLFQRVNGTWSLVRDFSAGGAYPSIQRIKTFGPILLVDTYLTGVWRSPDAGNTWDQVVPATNWGTWLSAKGDTLLALNGPDADLYWSIDQGMSWQTGSAAAEGLDYLADGDHIFIARSKDGRVYQSTTGLSGWQGLLELAPSDILYDVQETDDGLLLGTSYGTVRRAGKQPGWIVDNNGFRPAGMSELGHAGDWLIAIMPQLSTFNPAAGSWSAWYPPNAFTSVVEHNGLLIGHRDTTLVRYRIAPDFSLDTVVSVQMRDNRLFSIAGKLYAADPASGAIARSNDSGLSWAATGTLPVPAPAFTLSGRQGRLLWWSKGSYVLYGSSDEGLNWDNLYTFEGPIAAVLPVHDTLFAFVEADGYLFFSTDQGLIFKPVHQSGNLPFNALTVFDQCWADSGDLFVLDKDGRFFQSKDRGLNWLTLPLAPNAGAGGSGTRTAAGWYYDRDLQCFHLPTDALHTVSGRVYVDLNANGQQDQGESGVPFHPFGLAQADWQVSTGADGYFAFFIESLPDTLRPKPIPHFNIDPPFRVLTGNTDTAGFAVQPAAQVKDISVSLIAHGAFRPGFPNKITAVLRNNGTQTAGGQLRLIKDYRTGVHNTEPVATLLSPDTLLWNYNLGPLEVLPFQVTLDLSVFTNLGEVLTFLATAPQTADASPDDNLYILYDTIVGAYDPNDKKVRPERIATNLLDSATTFQYTIRFQNEGTYPTAFVVVRDTLADGLDPNTLQVLAASHPLQVEWPGGHEVVFRFNPLALAPKSQQELESQGFVRFSVRPKAGLAAGDAILNRAAIYFDYATPVVTNTVQTTVMTASGTEEISNSSVLRVSPNPANRLIVVDAPIPGETVLLFDANGRTVFQQKISGKRAECLLPPLPAGVYWLEWLSGNRSLGQQLVLSGRN